jgi:hypothetical protein
MLTDEGSLTGESGGEPRESPSQAPAIRPDIGARVTTAFIMTCRRCLASPAGYPAGPQLFFGFR